MEAAPSEWDVIIDGKITQKLVMTSDETSFVLASGLPAADHVVELYRRSEAISGTTQFLGFDFAGGTLLSPPARKGRRIEIIGDSASSGFGIEGIDFADAGDCPGPDHAAKWANFHKAYGAVLGDLVGAEIVADVHSGKGISKNIWRPDTETLPILFTRTLPEDPSSAWSFGDWKADVVIVMAGSNDFSIGEPTDDGPATLEQFTTAYRDFVTNIRSDYAQAHILLTVSPSLDDNVPPGSNTRTNVKAGAQAVVNERNQQGDTKVWFFEPNKAVASELTACLGHGNPAFHERVAAELAAFLKPKLGW
jgi:lysophospholipase L1-like esterase